jgi:hypothetical protein
MTLTKADLIEDIAQANGYVKKIAVIRMELIRE